MNMFKVDVKKMAAPKTLRDQNTVLFGRPTHGCGTLNISSWKTSMEINRKINRCCVIVWCVPSWTVGLLWFPSSSPWAHYGQVFGSTGMSCLDEALKVEIDWPEVSLLENRHPAWFYLTHPPVHVWVVSLLDNAALTLPEGMTDYLRSMLCPGTSQVQDRLSTCLSPQLSALNLPSPSCLDRRVLGKESRQHFLSFSHMLMMLQPILRTGKSYYVWFLFRTEV